MSKHRKASGPKPQGDRKQKANGRREPKDNAVAAELAAIMRDGTGPKPAPVPRPAPVSVPRAAPALAAPAASPVAAKAVAKDRGAPSPVAPKEVVKDKAPAGPVAAKKIVHDTSSPPAQLLDNAVDTLERSFKAAGQGTVAVNRKLIDFARANVSSSFDFAISLASASSPMQFMQLQVSYWDERMKALASQAEELRALSADLVAKTNEPIREHIRRAVNQT